MDIAIPMYDRFTALDAVGPYEVLSRLPGAHGHLARPESRATHRQQHARDRGDRRARGPPRARRHRRPGGTGTRALLEDERCSTGCAPRTRPRRGRRRSAPARCCSPPPGSSTGPATTHWLELETLGELGAIRPAERVVFDGKIVTAAGVSSGIDMALALAARIAGDSTPRRSSC